MSRVDVRWLTFDIIGTVFDVHGSLVRGIRTLAGRHGLALDAERCASGWVDAYGQRTSDIESGDAPWTPPDRLLHDALVEALAAERASDLSAERLDELLALWRTLEPWPDVRAGIAALHGRLGLCVLSNMSVVTQTALMHHARLPFELFVSAETAKHYNPNPEVYRRAVDALAAKPRQIMMVAAHDFDLDGAAEQGFRTAFIRRPLERGSEHPVDTSAAARFDVAADGIDDLAHRLGL